MSDLIDPVTEDVEEWSDSEVQNTDDDLATLLRRREHARPTRVTWVLLTLLVLLVGFVGGAFANQRWGASSSSSPSGFSGPPAGFTMPTAFPGGAVAAGAGSGSATVGTVKLVDGRRLYLTDSSGATVIVSVPKTASVTAQEDISLAGLSAGTSVTVQGTTAEDGSITATSVTEGSPAPSAVTPSASPSPSTQGEN